MTRFAPNQSYSSSSSSRSCCCGLCFCSRKTKWACCTLLWLPILALLGFLIALVVLTLITPDPFQPKFFAPPDKRNLMNNSDADVLAMAERLADVIEVPTVSYSPNETSEDALARLNVLLEESFPLFHGAPYVTFYPINQFSRLYRVEGSDGSAAGHPYMLCAHLDVVHPGKNDSWAHDPFQAGIVNEDGIDYIFGRGALDDKHNLMSILEALEYKVKNGDRPRRTFYLAFGHDEEVLGRNGAGQILIKLKQLLEKYDEQIDFILDEGLPVIQGAVPGVEDPLITIGVAEKGRASFTLTAIGPQGHSSIPPAETAVSVLAHAVASLKDTPRPSRFGQGPEIDLLRYSAPHASFPYRVVFSNMWLFSGLVSAVFSTNPTTDAMQRTSTAVTILRAGFKINVVPDVATASINHRLHTADTMETILQDDKETVDDERVSFRVDESIPPSKVSPYSNEDVAFQLIASSAIEVHPDAHPAPGLLIANTDTFHYQELTDKIYRFSPVRLMKDDVRMLHGVNEKISVDNYHNMVQFYYRLINNADYAGDIQASGEEARTTEDSPEQTNKNDTTVDLQTKINVTSSDGE